MGFRERDQAGKQKLRMEYLMDMSTMIDDYEYPFYDDFVSEYTN